MINKSSHLSENVRTSPFVTSFIGSVILNNIISQATGKSNLTGIATQDFVSVANTALQISSDALLNAISQTLSKTIFSVRPYEAKFKGLMQDSIRFGNHVRKLNIGDNEWETDVRYDLVDGESIDDQIVSTPKILQTNFYGQNVYTRHYTVYRDQLNIALSSEEEFYRFITMIVQNCSDMIEQCHESTARMTLANFIGGKIKGDATNVIHLVTKYNDVAGTTLTTDTVRQPSNFDPFIKWAFGYIGFISGMLTERSQKFHINVTGKEISRHTPQNKQKLYLFSEYLKDMNASVLSSIYNDRYLKWADHEQVNYWQSINTPDGIHVNASYMDNTGSIVIDGEGTATSNIFGVLFDEEAVGITTCDQWSSASRFNARGGYTNFWYHFNDRYYNDFTENGVVFLLD
jgi:hypothetical protein